MQQSLMQRESQHEFKVGSALFSATTQRPRIHLTSGRRHSEIV